MINNLENTEVHQLDWNGQLIEITLSPDRLMTRLTGEERATLKLRSLYPAYARIPMASSSSYPASTITTAGGPVNFVDVMLAAELQQAA